MVKIENKYDKIQNCFGDLVPNVIYADPATIKLNESQTNRNTAILVYDLYSTAFSICTCFRCRKCSTTGIYTKKYVQHAIENSTGVHRFENILKCCYKYVAKIIDHSNMLHRIQYPFKQDTFWFFDICCEKKISFTTILCKECSTAYLKDLNRLRQFQQFLQRYNTHVYKDKHIITRLIIYFDNWIQRYKSYLGARYITFHSNSMAEFIRWICEYSNGLYVYIRGSDDKLNRFLVNIPEKRKISLNSVILRHTFMILIYRR